MSKFTFGTLLVMFVNWFCFSRFGIYGGLAMQDYGPLGTGK